VPTQTISQQFIPREHPCPAGWEAPGTLAALQAELASPAAPPRESAILWELSRLVIRMPRHVHVQLHTANLLYGTSIMLPTNALISHYEITEMRPLNAPTEQIDLSDWPTPSRRPTTSTSALALERASRPDPQPRMPEVVIDDGFGV
jgi:hypothetical protein